MARRRDVSLLRHMLRACMSLLLYVEDEVTKRAPLTGPLYLSAQW
jgi:hypothetical protein